MQRIEDRAAFVTGAASGIGLGIAEALVRAGSHVILADIDAAELKSIAERLGERASCFVLDVTDRTAWARARATRRSHGSVRSTFLSTTQVSARMDGILPMSPRQLSTA